jgi:hypothetical protein
LEHGLQRIRHVGFKTTTATTGTAISINVSKYLLYKFFFFFFYLDYETIGTAATPGLLRQPRVIMKMIVESMMECRLAGETKVVGENLPQRHFCPSQNPTCPPGFEPGRRGGKPATNRLSYGAAYYTNYWVR